MEKEFVPYAQSLRLKALGFKERVLTYYENGIPKLYNNITGWDFNTSFTTCISRPTFSQVFRWFREKGYDVKVLKESAGLYFGFYWTGAAWIIVGNGTYEEAELACLDKLIEIFESKLEQDEAK